jgi:hypothetical protein|uniref:Uncharacterized protein n=1 Tax=Populus trichocarpa TaxID=3694 RepID=A9PDL7_POPTR|nr:unknown [Populus trichocarpa]
MKMGLMLIRRKRKKKRDQLSGKIRSYVHAIHSNLPASFFGPEKD